ncbi:SNF2 family N-terminal domain-containing protein [Coemansia spiralis]|nr:SNF2 family N-terminal domain-containing protein [Coemansia spiralis]
MAENSRAERESSELQGLSELGVRVMNQSTLERTVQAQVTRDMADKELEVEQKRLVRIESAIIRKQEQIIKSREIAGKFSSTTVRYQSAIERIERLNEEAGALERDKADASRRIKEIESQIGRINERAAERALSDSTPTVRIKQEPGAQHSPDQSDSSVSNLASMLVPKRKAAIAAEQRQYGLDRGENTGSQSASQSEGSDAEYNAAGSGRIHAVDEEEDAPSDDEFRANDQYMSTADELEAELASEVSSRARSRLQEQNTVAPDDDGNELSYQVRIFDWSASRWRERQTIEGSFADIGQAMNSIEDHSAYVEIDGQRIPRAQLMQEPFMPDPGTTDHLIRAHDRGKPSLRVPRQIWDKLLEYQKSCLNWMFTLHQQNAGGILGDEMGLGKTVQIAAFLAAMYHSKLLDRPSIVVCPATLLRQWVGEFHAWWPMLRVVILHGTGYGMRIAAGHEDDSRDLQYDLSSNLTASAEAEIWQAAQAANPGFGGDSSTITYNSTAGYDSADDYEYDAYGSRIRRKRRPRGQIDWRKRQQKKQKNNNQRRPGKTSRENLRRAEELVNRVHMHGHIVIVTYSGLQIYQDVLLGRKWGYAVLDEGHMIRNPDAEATIACKRLDTRHRILVTGTPIQNSLTELWSLFDFIFPGRLGTLPVFNNQFAIPITVGGYASANSLQVRAAYRCACILRDLIDPYLLRRLKADVAQDLPQKTEQVLFCRLTPMQRKAYAAFIRSADMERILQGKLQMLFGVDVARKICDHPDLLLLSTLPSAAGTHRESSTIKNVIAVASGEKDGIDESKNNSDADSVDNNLDSVVGRISDNEDEIAGMGGTTTDIGELPPDYGDWEKSGKLTIVRALLNMWKPQGHRVLIFSQTRQMLDIIESMISKMTDIKYRRMDGSTPIQKRTSLIDEYNRDPEIYVFLLTTKVGGLGINLTSADRVILYSPDWNPSSDIQARERAWRIGQTRDVAIYRLMTAGTIEEKIYNRQIYKQFLSNKILSDPKQKRFFHSQSLRDLFSLSGLGDNEDVVAGLGNNANAPRFYNARGNDKDKAGGESEESALEDRQEDIDGNLRHTTETGRIFASAQLHPRPSYHSGRDDDYSSDNEIDVETGSEIPQGDGQIEFISGVVRLEEFKHTNENTDREDSAVDKSGTSRQEGLHQARFLHQNTNKKITKRPTERVGENTEEAEAVDGENRVLQSLFKMSGVHSALQHDAIINSRDEGNLAIEREADRIARDARNALRESQRSRRQIDVNIPTWTGASGQAGISLHRDGGASSSCKMDPQYVPPPPSAILNNEIPINVQHPQLRAVGTPRRQPPPQHDKTNSVSTSTVIYHPSIAPHRPTAALGHAKPRSSVVTSLSMNNRSNSGVLPVELTPFGSHTVSGVYSTGSTVRNTSSAAGARVGAAESESPDIGTGLASSNILAGLRARSGGADAANADMARDTEASAAIRTADINQQHQCQSSQRSRIQQLPSSQRVRGGFGVSARSHGPSATRIQKLPHGTAGIKRGDSDGRRSSGQMQNDSGVSAQPNDALSEEDLAIVRCIKDALAENGGEMSNKALVETLQAGFGVIEQLRLKELAQRVADLKTRQSENRMSRAGIGRIVQKVWKLRTD